MIIIHISSSMIVRVNSINFLKRHRNCYWLRTFGWFGDGWGFVQRVWKLSLVSRQVFQQCDWLGALRICYQYRQKGVLSLALRIRTCFIFLPSVFSVPNKVKRMTCTAQAGRLCYNWQPWCYIRFNKNRLNLAADVIFI